MKPSRIPVRANLLPRQRILNDKILGITREPTARIREEGFAPHTSAVLAVSIIVTVSAQPGKTIKRSSASRSPGSVHIDVVESSEITRRI